MVPMRERRGKRLKSSMLAVEERGGSERKKFKIDKELGRSDCGEEAFDGISKGEKTAINERGDVLCEEDVVLRRVMGKSRQQGVEREKSKVLDSGVWMVVQQVEEKMGIPDLEKNVQCNKDIVRGHLG